jgi:hypothetical protein
MQSTPPHTPYNDPADPEFSFQHLLQQLYRQLAFLLRQWKILAAGAIIGGLIGLGYAFFKKDTFTASLSFVVEDPKANGGSLASALAGQFGLDISGLTGNASGLLAGDNILALVKSRHLLKETLLTPYDDTGHYSLADKYADVYGLKEKWEHSSKVGKRIDFPTNQLSFGRTGDSLLHWMIQRITEKNLSISKPDKKLSIIDLQVVTRDEILSKFFCERLLKKTTDFYIDSRTSRLQTNVNKLQHRADSIGLLLNRKTLATAENTLQLLDGNPAYAAPVTTAEIGSRDKMVLSAIYTEIIKNLELSKTALAQETPVVQVVDKPELPLKRNKTSKLLSLLTGCFLGVLLISVFIILLSKKRVPITNG